MELLPQTKRQEPVENKPDTAERGRFLRKIRDTFASQQTMPNIQNLEQSCFSVVEDNSTTEEMPFQGTVYKHNYTEGPQYEMIQEDLFDQKPDD